MNEVTNVSRWPKPRRKRRLSRQPRRLHQRRPAAEPVVEPTSVASVPRSSSGNVAIDSAEVARRLKEATVYIKNKVAGRTLSSGTGFVIEVQGDAVTVATNRHVAVFDLSGVPERLVPKGSAPELQVVFRSGQGLQNEQALPAQIIAADTSDDLSTDLAFLIVSKVSSGLPHQSIRSPKSNLPKGCLTTRGASRLEACSARSPKRE